MTDKQITAITERLDRMQESMNERMDSIEKKLEEKFVPSTNCGLQHKALDIKVDGLKADDSRIERKIDDLSNEIKGHMNKLLYWLLFAFGSATAALLFHR